MVLSSVTTSTAVSSATSSAVSMTTTIGLGIGGALIAVLLIFMLTSKELLDSSAFANSKYKRYFNFLIVPLLSVFVLEVAYRVISVI